MSRYLYISLVGTSILRNTAKNVKQKWSQKYPDIDQWFVMSLHDTRNTYPDGEICKIRELDFSLYRDLLEEACKLGEKASAEVYGLVGIANTMMHSMKEVSVLLLSTATCTSLLSAYLNKELLVDMGFSRVEIEVVRGFEKLEDFEKGLIELLDKAITRIVEAKTSQTGVYINAAPGFKVESSFLILASLLAGARGIMYIHETFHEPVFIPAIPIKIDESLMKLVLEHEGRIPREAWSTLDQYYRQFLEESGIVRRAGDYWEIRPWIRILIEKIKNQ